MAEPQWSEESFHVKERRRFETPRNQAVYNQDGTPMVNPDGTRAMGQKCVGFEMFPKMVYRAQKNHLSGRYEVGASRDILSQDKTTVIFNAEEFSRTCQHIVRNEEEYVRAKSEGWRDTPREAMEYHEGTETEKMVATAVRNYEDRNMSDAAKAEAARHDASTTDHVPEVPESRKRKAS